MACNRCKDVGWVCENHLDKPWDRDLPEGCECGAGAPCPDCNPLSKAECQQLPISEPPSSATPI